MVLNMYSTMKAYGMKRKTTKGQKHFVTDDVNERKLTKGEEKKKKNLVKGYEENKDDSKSVTAKMLKQSCMQQQLRWQKTKIRILVFLTVLH